jgi:hypothetical protein
MRHVFGVGRFMEDLFLSKRKTFLHENLDLSNDIEDIKNIAKCYYKLYLKQQEVVSSLGVPNVN